MLLYVVYTCQKSFNFINAFVCYKQKCELAPFNLAHPVRAKFHLYRSNLPLLRGENPIFGSSSKRNTGKHAVLRAGLPVKNVESKDGK